MEEKHLDEGLYSRQLYVLGHEAMKRMLSSSILLIGLKGLGVEIAKNLILSGVKSLTVHDKKLTSLEHLSAQYYLKMSDIGKPIDACSLESLCDLNRNVDVSIFPRETLHLEQDLPHFNVVIFTDGPLEEAIALNEFCHAKGIAFIYSNVYGLFGSIFCDFGNEFVVLDSTGEEAVSGLIGGITRDEKGLVTLIEDTRHNLEDGDYVIFKNVKGSVELNDAPPMPIKVVDPYSFSIGDTRALSPYVDGGEFHEVKQPKKMSFRSLKETLSQPQIVISDFAKIEHGLVIHLGFMSLSTFSASEGRMPKPRNAQDADLLLKFAEKINGDLGNMIEAPFSESDANILREIAYGSSGYLPAIATTIGGLVAQEALKAVSGKFGPIEQYLYFDALESLPVERPTEEACQPIGSRYDLQIAVLGKPAVDALHKMRVFLVGSGAIGCELLKVWAMMGVGVHGHVTVTDMDTIEKSNLSRQLLFRNQDIGKLKAQTATAAVLAMNSDFTGHITALSEKVGAETEHIFSDTFFDKIDVVVNALDNVEARRYMDRRCVFYCKPLLESGTLGTKGNTQVVVPHLTESYSSSQDPPEKSIPFCTLKNFPYQIEHTIQWAMDLFQGLFYNAPEQANQFMADPSAFVVHLQKGTSAGSSVAAQIETIEGVVSVLGNDRPTCYADCIAWARLQFETLFANSVKQLIFNFPSDAVTSSGTPFWSGPKRCPVPLTFDLNDATHLGFVNAAAQVRAATFHIQPEPLDIAAVLRSVQIPPFVPKGGVKIHTSDAEAASDSGSAGSLEEALSKLQTVTTKCPSLEIVEFEKDDDTNFHVDFVTFAANLRAINYGIQPADRHKAKGIAGKIIPAIATTTAFVSGLVCLELMKLVDRDTRKIEDYKNAFANLALPFFAFSEPIAAPKQTYGATQWTLWDRFNVKGDMILRDFLTFFEETHQLEITMASHGRSMLFGFIRQKDELEKRMAMSLWELLQYVTKSPFADHVQSAVVEVLASDLQGEDVEIPFIVIHRP